MLTQGYTIVEVMVFLAVAGLMFVLAATFISGKQSKAEFKQGINAVNTQVQQVISDVSNGYYPPKQSFSCSSTGAPNLQTTTPNEQGANADCVFLGKVIQFSDQQAGMTAPDPAAYSIFTVVGNQFKDKTTLTPPTNFAQAQPTVAYTSTRSNVNLTESKRLEWSIEVTKMYDANQSGNPSVGAVGFFSSFSGTISGSGSQTVSAVAIPSSKLNLPESKMVRWIDDRPGGLDNAAANAPNPKIILCLKGGVNDYGTLTIGGSDDPNSSGQRLSTSIQISATPIGACLP